jgi:dimethylhistidine N-methyltransferase
MALDDYYTTPDVHSEQREELLAGLLSRPRSINPKFLYDERGSELFSRICELEEYYPTRTEVEILDRQSADIARVVGAGCELVEPGAGNCEKVRYLLHDLQPSAYLPLDISGDFLLEAAERLRESFPQLDVQPVVADFNETFDLPGTGERRVVFYPGSTIGNFEPDGAGVFLRRAADLVGPGGGLLVGVDLHKDSAILNAAYNDSEGVTAAFNRNILLHANALLDADFDPGQFEHVAFYNEDKQRIEIYLESRADQQVRCDGALLEFQAGERIHTEYSHKYTVEGFARMAAEAGFTPRACWIDDDELFSVQYFEV